MTDILSILEGILKTATFAFLYLIIGAGPGFILGTLTINRLVGKRNDFHMDVRNQAIQEAAEHNKQWHPDEPRWQK